MWYILKDFHPSINVGELKELSLNIPKWIPILKIIVLWMSQIFRIRFEKNQPYPK
jgi:hypothetical protein